MEKKEPIKISLPMFISIIVILVACICGFYVYSQNQKLEKEITNLKEQISLSQTEKNELQEKLNSITRTINSSDTEQNTEQQNTSNNSTYTVESTIIPKFGNYTVDQIKVDEAGVSNSECGVTLKDDNKFEIYMGWGASHSGIYEIKDNNLICKSNLLNWSAGPGDGSRKTDVIFTFNIISDNQLELTDIDINDTDKEKTVFNDGLKEGMTYSIK